MPRNPSFRGKSIARRIVTQYSSVADYWVTMAPPPPPAPAQTPDPYFEAVKAAFAPRVRPALGLATPGWRAIVAACTAEVCARCGLWPTSPTPDGRLCMACLLKAGHTPAKAPQPAPMPPEEIARRRAARLTEERPRRWRGDLPDFDRTKPHFLKVFHEEEGDGEWKMVGKLDLVNMEMIRAYQMDLDRARRREEPTGAWRDLADGEPELVFFHAHSGTQRHRNFNSPAPLDTVVHDFLKREGIAWVCCYERAASAYDDPVGILRYAPTFRFDMFSPEVEYDGRWRYYLSEDHWELVPGVSEFKRRDGGSLLHVGADREVILSSPYIPEKQALRLRRAKP